MVFSTKKIAYDNFLIESATEGDFYIKRNGEEVSVQNIGDKEVILEFKGKVSCNFNGAKSRNQLVLKPGSVLKCSKK